MADTKYIFFLDIDGTLYCDGEICEENRRAIETVRKNGHLVFLNTGRAPGIIPPKVLALELDGAVTALGSNVIVNGEYIYSQVLPTEALAQIFTRFDESGRKVLFEGNDCVIINGKYDPCGYDAVTVSTAEEFVRKYGDRAIPKVFIPHVLPESESALYSADFTFFQHPTYVEISPKGDTKATGIGHVLDFFAPEKYVTVAMGDSLNDMDMLEFADISVAMGDGHPKITEICDIVTCDGAKGGVAEAMARITGLDFSR